MSSRLSAKLKKIYAERGEYQDSVSLVLWDICTACTDDRCPVVDRCTYTKNGPCSMEVQYLNAVSGPVVRMLQDPAIPPLTEIEFLDFGLKYLPLCHDLVRIKKAILVLDSVLTESSQGIKVHPLFKEKRDIIKAIENLHITDVLRKKFRNLKNVSPGYSSDEMDEWGDPDLAEELEQE